MENLTKTTIGLELPEDAEQLGEQLAQCLLEQSAELMLKALCAFINTRHLKIVLNLTPANIVGNGSSEFINLHCWNLYLNLFGAFT